MGARCYLPSPAAQKLYITGALSRAPSFSAPPNSTSLEELSFLDCNLTPNTLSRFLTLPRALRRLTFKSHRRNVTTVKNKHLNVIKTQSHSLEVLHLYLNADNSGAPLNFHKFSVLQELEVDPRLLALSPWRRRAINNKELYFPSGSPVFPPSIQRIIFRQGLATHFYSLRTDPYYPPTTSYAHPLLKGIQKMVVEGEHPRLTAIAFCRYTELDSRLGPGPSHARDEAPFPQAPFPQLFETLGIKLTDEALSDFLSVYRFD